jgi:VanZ family protein
MSTSTDTTSPRSSTAVRWAAVIGWIALIYTTIPFVRLLQTWFTAHWDRALIGHAVVAVLVVTTVTVLVALRRLASRPSLATAAWLAVIAAVYTWWAISLRRIPEEAVHLLEYGVLGVLLYRALRPRIPDVTVYVVTALIGLLVGSIDEVIQWITPRRFFDFRDIFLNSGSCTLALAAVWRIEGPSPEPVTARSLRRVARWAIAVVALYVVVLSVTPTRVQRWADRFPGVTFLQSPDNEMAEYGHRHVLPEIGQFKSRFTIEQLRAEDTTRAEEVAAILDRYPDRRYGRFLREVPPQLDPFAHEARVHISSRDHHLRKQTEFPEGSHEARHHASAALRQHQILEGFFRNTLHSSSYDLPPATIERLEQQQLPDFLWYSWTSRHLITWISEPALRVTLITIIVALAALHFVLGSRNETTFESEGART